MAQKSVAVRALTLPFELKARAHPAPGRLGAGLGASDRICRIRGEIILGRTVLRTPLKTEIHLRGGLDRTLNARR